MYQRFLCNYHTCLLRIIPLQVDDITMYTIKKFEHWAKVTEAIECITLILLLDGYDHVI